MQEIEKKKKPETRTRTTTERETPRTHTRSPLSSCPALPWANELNEEISGSAAFFVTHPVVVERIDLIHLHLQQQEDGGAEHPPVIPNSLLIIIPFRCVCSKQTRDGRSAYNRGRICVKLNPELNVHSWFNIFYSPPPSRPAFVSTRRVDVNALGMVCQAGRKEVTGSLAHQETIIWPFFANVPIDCCDSVTVNYFCFSSSSPS